MKTKDQIDKKIKEILKTEYMGQLKKGGNYYCKNCIINTLKWVKGR